jgi:hypothetical protein
MFAALCGNEDAVSLLAALELDLNVKNKVGCVAVVGRRRLLTEYMSGGLDCINVCLQWRSYGYCQFPCIQGS